MPGIPPHMVEDVIVLDYDDYESLDVIRKFADELAAVLDGDGVPIVTSRNGIDCLIFRAFFLSSNG